MCVWQKGGENEWSPLESVPGYFLHLHSWRRAGGNPPGVEKCGWHKHAFNHRFGRMRGNRQRREREHILGFWLFDGRHLPSIIKDSYVDPELVRYSRIRLLSLFLLPHTILILHPSHPPIHLFWWRPSINKDSVLSVLFRLLLYYLFSHPSTAMVSIYGGRTGMQQIHLLSWNPPSNQIWFQPLKTLNVSTVKFLETTLTGPDWQLLSLKRCNLLSVGVTATGRSSDAEKLARSEGWGFFFLHSSPEESWLEMADKVLFKNVFAVINCQH